MNKCLTLVANTTMQTEQLQQLLCLPLRIITIHQRAASVWDITLPPETQLTPELRAVFYENKLDFALQNSERPEKKLFLSDMDATIVVGETIDEMAAAFGVYDEISAVTIAAMQGEISYRSALAQRLALLKGMSKETITQMAQQTQLAQGAERLLNEINRREMDSCLISGGFTVFTSAVSRQLGFQRHIANRLSYDENGQLDGHWIGDLVSAEVKEATLKILAQENHLSPDETVAIGDGANDIRMLKQAGLGVAFYGKPILREACQAEIHSGTIDHLIWFL